MNEQKSLLLEIAEVVDRHLRRPEPQEENAQPVKSRSRWLGKQLVPNIGTLLMVVVLLLTIPSLAAPLIAPSATSTSTISYQGRLADSGGNPLTGFQTMVFRIYDVPTGGEPLWIESWTGDNSVAVSDGLFNVMLGSIDNTLAASIEGYDELYLGITVGSDSEMAPRVQLGSVPFSMQAMTVPDGSITTEKIADEAVTQAKLGSDISLEPPAGSITTTMLADGAVTADKLAGRGSGLQTWEHAADQVLAATGATAATRVTFDTGIDVEVPNGTTQAYLVVYRGSFGYNYGERTGTNTDFHGFWTARLVDGETLLDDSTIVTTGYRIWWDAVIRNSWGTPYSTAWIVQLDSGVHSLDIEIWGYSDETMDFGHVNNQSLEVFPLF